MTFSLETLIMIGVIMLCAGGVIGALISKTYLPPSRQKDLEQQLQATRNQLELYQQDVAKHFVETAQLVNNLTQTYKDVHDHLSRGAVHLTNAEISKKMLNAGDPTLGFDAKNPLDEFDFEAPKDWAPKAPGQKGILSEDFGLEDPVDDDLAKTKTTTNKKMYESGKHS